MGMIPTPRKKYHFVAMKVGDVIDVEITPADPKAGARALCAAYAYGRRNNLKFCGKTEEDGGKKYMRIARCE